jgi:hypothetical protein
VAKGRIGRGAVLALVGGGSPLLGHSAGRLLAESAPIVAVALLLLGVGLCLAAGEFSFPKLTCVLFAGQVAMHSVLGLAGSPPSGGYFWVKLADLVPGELAITLIQAALFCGFDCCILAWFCIATIRLFQPTQLLAGLATPDVRGKAAHREPVVRRAVLLTGSCGRRAPPAPHLL